MKGERVSAKWSEGMDDGTGVRREEQRGSERRTRNDGRAL